MNEINRKISITKPRRSAIYDIDAPSGVRYRAVINKTSVKLTKPGYTTSGYSSTQGLLIPAEDLESIIDLLTEAQVEHAEQVKLEGDAA